MAASGASNDQTRRHNLSVILDALHHDGSQPRSQLTARSGLNRSTVAALVGELAGLDLVFESEPDPTKLVGRPSPTVQVDPRTVAFAVNPELDAITVGVVSLGGKVIARVRHENVGTPSARDAVEIAAAEIATLRAGFASDIRVVGVGVAVPGLVRASDGLVRLAPHLDWHDEPLADLLAEATALPVSAANDASLGARAELLFGSGRGMSNLIYLNGGASGIGGGIIAGGVSIGGAGGYAGEFGHIRVNSAVGHYDDPETGSLESEVNQQLLLSALGLDNADADELESALLSSTDPAVDELVHRQLEFLSTSLRNAVNVLNPELIVLGGFLGSLYARDPEFLEKRVGDQSLAASFENVTIARAALGSSLLMIGAAELAFAPLLLNPAG